MNPDKHMWNRLAAVALAAVGSMGVGACTERIDVMVGPFDVQEPLDDASLDADSGAPEDAAADTAVVDVEEDVGKDANEHKGIPSGHRCTPGKQPRGGCEEGLVCLSDKYGGVCAEPCDPKRWSKQCENNGECIRISSRPSTPASPGFCTHQCAPWDPGACGDKAGCREVICDNPGQSNGKSWCEAQIGKRDSGETCTGDDECKPGWWCINKTCRKLCRVDEGHADCSADSPDSNCSPFEFPETNCFICSKFTCYFAGNEIGLCTQKDSDTHW